ncbi:helix-turn-helix domain-containing protein [Lacticaseibacillus zhaodongensis]|uniref:helix-turn-helix domain-containing protein n=1 Tax=Lacticaseibacillus zhaodongensis TaxID=2668065 RepID=UPI0012D2D9D9|nr:helix-turn-helix transcriptional regulator [Lacticaseibacillus zhaodongensis]
MMDYNYGAAFRELRRDFGLRQKDLVVAGLSAQTVSRFEKYDTGLSITRVAGLLGQVPATIYEYTIVLETAPIDGFDGFLNYVSHLSTRPDAHAMLEALGLRNRIRYAATGNIEFRMRAVMLSDSKDVHLRASERKSVLDYLQRVQHWTKLEFILLRRSLDTVLELTDVLRVWTQLTEDFAHTQDEPRLTQRMTAVQAQALLHITTMAINSDNFFLAHRCIDVLHGLDALSGDTNKQFWLRSLEANLMMRDPQSSTRSGRELLKELIAASEFVEEPTTTRRLEKLLADSEEYLRNLPQNA